MKLVSPSQAVQAIPDASTVIFPHGCVEPMTFYGAFAQEVERFNKLTIYSGLGLWLLSVFAPWPGHELQV